MELSGDLLGSVSKGEESDDCESEKTPDRKQYTTLDQSEGRQKPLSAWYVRAALGEMG